MEYKSTLIVVKDIDQSVKFYKEVLNLEVINDFGANKTLTGGLSLQTYDTYKEFINKEIQFKNNSFELYFEEDDFDSFLNHLKTINIEYAHPMLEHRWKQRVIRFYDLDHHIVEVGENIQSVCQRLLESGMSVEEVAKQMDVPIDFVKGNKHE